MAKSSEIKIAPNLLIFILTGITYVFIEVVFTAIFGEMRQKFHTPVGSSMGFSSIYMGIVGGLMGLVLGLFNEIPGVRQKLNLFFQSLIGAVIITAMELVAGLILNVWLKFDIWDYSNYPLNFMGQIALFRSVLWFFLCPVIFWFDDNVRAVLYNIGEPYSLVKYYLQLFNFKAPKTAMVNSRFRK